MKRLCFAASILLGLSGCTIADTRTGSSVLERYQVEGSSAWSLTFGDPVLADLLRRADLNALDVKLAMARLAEAGATVDLATAERGPVISLGGAAAVGERDHLRKGAALPLSGEIELDLWGRLARAQDAAKSDHRAASFDAAWARLLVAAAVTGAYLDLRGAEADYARAVTSAGLSEQAEAIAETRSAAGVIAAADLGMRHRARIAADNAVAASEREVERQRGRLFALLGSEPLPADLSESSAVPQIPAIGELKSSRAADRPDVQAAFARFEAADARRAEAVAAAQPRFLLSASLGGGDPSVVNLLDVTSLAWAVAGDLSGSLFDNGAAKARIDEAASEADIADLTYRRAVVAAWQQQREALLTFANAADAGRESQTAEALVIQARTRTDRRRREGLTDAFEGIGSEVAVIEAAATRDAARLSAAHALVDLTLACGGAAL